MKTWLWKTLLLVSMIGMVDLIGVAPFMDSLETQASAAVPKDDSAVRSGESIEFTRHVLPILSKLGCNTGACHGALAGKGGFKLSLNGYNPSGDHFNISKQSLGRRIEMADPGRSLILAKPTGLLPHKGGLKLESDSEEYKLLADWIANGATGPAESDAKLERLDVEPKQIALAVGESTKLKVSAVYSDGRTEDVTRWAKYTSNLTPVVSVDEDGVAEVVGQGEGSVVVWFSSQLAVSTITSPFDSQAESVDYKSFARKNFIDDLVLQKLETLKLTPSPRCDDSTFLRRVYLDTLGVLPTAEEAKSFLADQSPDKRNMVIEAVLERDEFVDLWAYHWSDVLLVNGNRLRPKAVKSYYQWLRGHLETNTPWDELVREVVTAQGSSYENGATNFYALHQTPEDMAENVSQAFLGLSIGCAKCHNHPLEKWTNDQYYAMANLFSRVRAKGWGGDARNGDGLRTVFLTNSGELDQPLTGQPQPPTPLDGIPLEFDDPNDRRIHLAKWLTAKENPYFSRSVVNRIWANYMGRGLVENVDDMRVSNPATNEPLLAALADYVVEQKYDLKSLVRLILQSETYQRSSEAVAGNKLDDRFYARAYPRRLMAEVLLDSISQVTEVPTEFNKISHGNADTRPTKEYPIGTRAIQLYDSAVISKFLSTFGRNKRDIVCECERSDKPSMVQVLHIANGVTINEKLKSNESCVSKLFVKLKETPPEKSVTKETPEKQEQNKEKPDGMKAKKKEKAKPIYEPIESPTIDVAAEIKLAYLKTLSRYPTEAELSQFDSILSGVPPAELRESLEDMYWGLMSSREFLFQH